MKFIIALFLLCNIAFSKVILDYEWDKGETLISFLNKKYIPIDIYFNLSKIDKELSSEIRSGTKYQIAYKNDIIENILIPISEEMQIHIYKKNLSYQLELIPIIYSEVNKILFVNIKKSPYDDIIASSNNYKLAHEFVRNFKKAFNFRILQPNDKIAIKYIQKIRLGKYYGTPEIIATTVQGKYQKIYVYKNPSDERYYDEKAKSLTSVFFKVPLIYSRISSKFTHKRFHPIKKRYTAHLGIDYAAPIGRKIRATAPGRIVYKGRKGGYGNTIEISHKGGFKSLYAHQSKFSPHIKRGSIVKQGQLIGYVGSTGQSTGPHLHFGLYKNGKAINPAKVMRYSTSVLKGQRKKEFFKFSEINKNELLATINDDAVQFKIDPFENSSIISTDKKITKDYTVNLY